MLLRIGVGNLLIEPENPKEGDKRITCPDNTAIEEASDELKIIWKFVIIFLFLHVGAVYGLYLLFVFAKWQTIVFTMILNTLAGLGITAGAHRLWSHRSYKATKPLRVILLVFTSLAFQFSVIDWVKYHRLHHKYSDTDADPHNSKRGFFFSHLGWLVCDLHQSVKDELLKVELGDLYCDPLLVFQKKYFNMIGLFISFIVPTSFPVLFWNETLKNSFFVTAVFRLALSYNSTSLINSLAHKWGYKPYDKNIQATENMTVSALTCGEGYHNYHHAFPWDYKAAELGNYKLNLTTKFLDLCGSIGWAYDFRTAPESVVQKRMQRTG